MKLSVNVTEIYSFPYMHKAILTPSFYHDIVCYDTHRWGFECALD